MTDKIIMKFVPFDFVVENNLSFTVGYLGLLIDKDNWPCNLIHNPNLIHSDDEFYEQFTCDSTLFFYLESVTKRIVSLISRATHNPNIKWEHGNINIFELERNLQDSNYVTNWPGIRTRTNLALRKLIDHE